MRPDRRDLIHRSCFARRVPVREIVGDIVGVGGLEARVIGGLAEVSLHLGLQSGSRCFVVARSDGST